MAFSAGAFPPVFIVGAGSVGTFLAARLSRVPGLSVTLIARDRALPGLSDGIVLTGTQEGRFPVSCRGWSGVGRFPEGSVVLLTSKLFNLGEGLREIEARWPAAGNARVFLCQNGLGVVEEAERTLPARRGAFGRVICWFGTRLEPPARVRVAGVQGVELAGPEPELLAALGSVFATAELPHLGSAGVLEVEWRKALWNVTLNGLCALADAPNGALLDDPDLRLLGEQLLKEAVEVAHRADGVRLGEADQERVFRATRNTELNFNSTVQDLRSGRPTEMPWLNGAVIARADRHGLAVPGHRFVYHVVRHLEKSGAHRRKSVEIPDL